MKVLIDALRAFFAFLLDVEYRRRGVLFIWEQVRLFAHPSRTEAVCHFINTFNPNVTFVNICAQVVEV